MFDDLANLVLCAIVDRGLGKAAASVREFFASGAVLVDLVSGGVSGGVSASGVGF
ncbi:hypothetical protein [Nitrobacter sp. Nb-311A]|uniref:hypothetical protein n=1 Tax=Nitrobacter sp. Nb-311A TaxID=314253 RepID=UPI0013EFA92C|nr:hypothetical protein [Nitrobacter sp. Nb-311A]